MPSKRARYRPGLAGTVRDRPDTPLTTDHITLSDREAPGERAPSRRSDRRWPGGLSAEVAPEPDDLFGSGAKFDRLVILQARVAGGSSAVAGTVGLEGPGVH